MAVNQNKKRRAMSISEMAGPGSGEERVAPRHRSSYAGPKRPTASGSDFSRPSSRPVNDYDRRQGVGSSYVNTVDGYGYAPKNPATGRPSKPAKASSGYVAPSRVGGIMDYAWIAYVGILGICLVVAMLGSGSGKKSGIYYPRNLIVTNGILDYIYDEYYSGGLGSKYTGSEMVSTQSEGGTTASDGTGDTGVNGAGGDTAVAGDGSLPNSTTGATMALDTGGSFESYSEATSHEQLVEQLNTALAASDVQFVGRKLAYKDEASGNLIGYPQSVVEIFVAYMAINADKRDNFISEIKADSFSAKNENAFVIQLPLLKFTINMGYDNTTVAVSGFADNTLNAGQSATLQPILPCMYTICIAGASGSQVSEVEANMNEGNLQINIGSAK